MKRIESWFHLYSEDTIKTILNLFLVVAVFAFCIYAPQLIRYYFINRFESKTIGIIDKIEARKGIHETREGGKVVLTSYKVDYHFEAEESVIKKSQIISRNTLQYEKWYCLSQWKIGDTILVKYDSDHPNKSMIEVQ